MDGVLSEGLNIMYCSIVDTNEPEGEDPQCTLGHDMLAGACCSLLSSLVDL